MPGRFRNRADAGRQLAEALGDGGFHRPVVLALPRGGVPVAYEVAARLGAPLTVFVARKVGAPGRPELGIGAVAEGGTTVVDETSTRTLGVAREEFDALAARAREELDRRVMLYRGGGPLPDARDRDVILVDDGLATGVTAEAALGALRAHDPRRLVLAVPVGAPQTVARLGQLADDIVCLLTPRGFSSVALWYDDFEQTSDDEVRSLLAGVATPSPGYERAVSPE